ncbi:TlpA disulfide reductase family protein [Fulvimonas soli]|jgi:thiol-disulfide isomerase/thioredoxin|uniref:Thiol-disulfide isomerase/thioredoxin n=1 Tax=Fulvimonas soli TaxID=155197 RepID=A0A316IND8_9GAMM|nr:TlpA disulfide reductase family protein [Fulvimonas soli]PWK92028.1 thiol-disulfide isomerase/thioredoxin [Fulvimonas soli]TNY25780.1 hypothetical protein BV497_12120 [Fulvimonas soli]
MTKPIRGALAALLSLGIACAHAAAGDAPPDYLGTLRDGTPVHAQQFQGKVVVVTFWATWCGYCMKELPVLANIQRLAGAARLQVVAISHDEERSTYVQVARQLKDLGLVLAYDGDKKAAAAFGVNGIPHMVMIGRDGRIAHVHVGYDQDMLPTIADELNALLAAPAASSATP